jgi:hypothetical protein
LTVSASGALNAMGEHTHRLLSASRTTVMRVGYGNPKNRTLAPSAIQMSRSIWLNIRQQHREN